MAEKDYILSEILDISGANPVKCMKCGKCSAVCPSFNEMTYPPHLVVDLFVNGRVDDLLATDAFVSCMSCFACLERCPRSVEPARLVDAVRVYMLRLQGKNHLLADMVPESIDDETPQQAIAAAFRKYSKG